MRVFLWKGCAPLLLLFLAASAQPIPLTFDQVLEQVVQRSPIVGAQHLMEREGKGFRDAIFQGSMGRLSPILMTRPGHRGEPGKEIQQPIAVVILGGIFTSTLLNMIVIPALFLKYEDSRRGDQK